MSRGSKAGNPKVGKQRMTSHRTISLTLTLLAVLMIVVPSSAVANSLLSGYGGPGEGNQAILGSALLGGTGRGSGSSGSTGSSPSDATRVGVQAGRSNAVPTGSNGRGGGASGSRSRSGDASGDAASAYPVVSRGNTAQPASETLGLSGEDLAYVLLALGALVVTGVITRRLARITRPESL